MIIARVSRIAVLIAVGACLIGLGGCSHTTSAISRETLYNSLQAMADDSTVIVIGTPTSERVASDTGDNIDFTLDTFVVDTVVKGQQTVEVHDTITVRQTGTRPAGTTNTKTSGQSGVLFLDLGTRYLLYLTAWDDASEDSGAQYYITGVDAGIYVASTTDGSDSFTRANPDSGDTLPDSVTIQGALG